MLALAVQLLLAQSSPPTVKDGIAAYEAFQTAQARALLQQAIASHPKTNDAAKAHLYLGLIAFDDLDIDLARKEFRGALALNPAIELPLMSSPKARGLFAQLQQQFNEGRGEAAPPAAAPMAPAPTPEARADLVEAPAGARPLSPSAWIALGSGAALAIAGAVVGGLSIGPLNQANASTTSISTAQSLQPQITAEHAVADVCFAAAIAGGVAGLVLVLTR